MFLFSKLPLIASALLLLLSACGGGSGSDSPSTVTVTSTRTDTPPDVAITSAARSFAENDVVTLTCTATDLEDGIVINNNIRWRSNLDGVISATGNSIDTSALSIGEHTITVSVTDSDGNLETAVTTIKIYDGLVKSLGGDIFNDTDLSSSGTQSCASCHQSGASGFADPDSFDPFTAVSNGAVPTRFGSRNAPTASYAALIPDFTFVPGGPGGGHFVGGQFLDGRASTLEIQAQGPFLNELEMNMADKDAVIDQIKLAAYVADFQTVFGANALDDVDMAYQQMSEAIAIFERTPFFSPFTSKFDAVQAGTAFYTVSEANGLRLFNRSCVRCHDSGSGGPQVFSNFEYQNIGVPGNPDNQFLTLAPAFNPDGINFVDNGLAAALPGGVAANLNQLGKFRTSSLRNVAKTAPYMHNGVFGTLEAVMRFYNERDVAPVITPEVAQNVDNVGDMGNMRLSPRDIMDLVNFMNTLSDT